ncbi:PTS system mannose/fructose/sorbose family transporter subunit IID [Desulfovibrio sp. OttesenSCG-928-G15]|nr:PTS system mannose/fructose/sorbose family transporter subunit IID [Desulfovibrio sp. OttesenSCG-928-G15]
MSIWTSRTLLGCFFRSYMVSAASNADGLQNVGFLYAIEPALATLYKDGKGLAEARMRYARRYNSHPFFTPMLLGIFLRLEADIAAGRMSPAVLLSVKDTTANALSALGDSFFNGTLLATWALLSCCLLLADSPGMAFAFTAVCFVSLQLFKFVSFFMGLSKGLSVLAFLRKLDLINWGDHFKFCNAALLGCFLWLCTPDAPVLVFGGVALYLVLAGWIIGKLHFPRICVALFLLACAVALHFSGWFGHIPTLLFSI